MTRKPLAALASILALLLVASPALAYTIFLKDGSTIVAKEEPRVEGDRVIITLPSGTETFLPLDEVDLEETRDFNAKNLEGALVVEGGQTRGLPVEQAPPKETLKDLIESGQARTRSRAPVRRPEAAGQTGPERSSSGYVDLDSLRRQAYGDLEIMSELRSYFTSQGLEAQVFAGTKSTHPMIEVVTSSESAVFKSLEVAAQALPQMQGKHASRITALELLLRTSRGSAAGQFVMTPELADRLNSGQVDAAAFFVRHVQF